MGSRDIFAGMIILVQLTQRQATAQTAPTYAVQRPAKMKTVRLESPSNMLFLSRPCELCCMPSKSADRPYEKVSKNGANSCAKRRNPGRFLAMKLDTGNVNTDFTWLTARRPPDEV